MEFSYYFFLSRRTNGKQTASKLTFFPSCFSLILHGFERLMGIILEVNLSLQLAKGL